MLMYGVHWGCIWQESVIRDAVRQACGDVTLACGRNRGAAGDRNPSKLQLLLGMRDYPTSQQFGAMAPSRGLARAVQTASLRRPVWYTVAMHGASASPFPTRLRDRQRRCHA